MSDFSTWYNSVPRFTRYWLSATVGISVAAKLGLLPVQYLYLDTGLVFQKFQVSHQMNSNELKLIKIFILF
jgi:derlin-1